MVSTNNNNNRLLTKWDGSTSNGHINYFLAYYTNNGQKRFLFDKANSRQTVFSNSTALNDGTWHQVVGVYDGTNVLMYVDGTLQTDQKTITGPLHTATADPALSAIARDELATAIATLPTLTRRQRACLIGAMSGYSYPELALQLGTTRKAVSESVRRARRVVFAALRGP